MQEFLILSKEGNLEYTEKFSELCEVYFKHLKRKFQNKYTIEVIISEDYILNLIFPLNTLKLGDSKELIFNKIISTKFNGKYIKNYNNGDKLLAELKEFLDCSSNVNLDISSFEGKDFTITVRKNTLEISRLIF